MTLPRSATEELEKLIDTYGLLHVATGLELVCGEKADHLRANWGDRITAKEWDKASTACGALARRVSDLGV